MTIRKRESIVIVVLGDLHGAIEIGIAVAAKARSYRPGLIPVIQVGDLGWHPRRRLRTPPWPVYFVDGNHDHLPSLLEHKHDSPAEVAPNFVYCPRGSVLTLDGRRIGFLGGAKSIDREFRERGEEWWDEEEPTHEEAMRLKGQKIDLLITHSPPSSVVRDMGYSENDYASVVVQEIWEELGQPNLVCGHMHRRYRRGKVLVLGDLDAEVID